MKKRAFCTIFSLILTISLTACGGDFSNKQLHKMMESNDVFENIDIASAKVIDQAETTKGMISVLFSAKSVDDGTSRHYIAFADTKSDTLTPLEFSYLPMEYLRKEITLNRHQKLNMQLLERLNERIADDKDFFKDEEKSKDFLQSITEEDGILSTETAKKAIEEFAKIELELTDAKDFCGVFEEGSAVPLGYAVRDVGTVYAWDWLPEAQYLSFVSNNRDELKKAEEEYGPAYKDDDAWILYDISGEEQGTFKTKAALFEHVTGEKADFGEEEEKTGVLRLVTVSDNKPFAYSEGSNLTGIDIEVARKIADELNMEIEISATSKATAIKGTGDNKFNMAMAGFIADDSYSNVTFTDNYLENYVIVLPSGNGELNGRICVALAKLKSSGAIDGIAKKYDLSSIQEPAKEQDSTEEAPPQIAYRVRKSAEDSATQAGAFTTLENAKKEANNRKDEGYKVYDLQGNLIYTP